ncbi:MAG: DUF58 domain-containing protein [Pseudomonadales bacterium]|jgi:uncharacterized protein (DUF58 family)|nr:DUF58 domain-containing protein [Pseudomonadales bacterium]
MKEADVIQGAYISLPQLLALRHKSVRINQAQSTKVMGSQSGIKLSKVKGRGIDFAEVRAYQPGDDIRAIDWRVTARKNKPHTKIFREERERPALIYVDQSQHMFFGSTQRLKSVAAAELAGRIAWQTLAAGDRIGGIVIGNEEQTLFRPFRTTRAVGRLLNQIASANQTLTRSAFIDTQESKFSGLEQLRRLTQSNYRIFIISDFSGDIESWSEQIKQLARHNHVTLLHIQDPLDKELPPADHYVITDGNERLQFYSGKENLRKKYADEFAQRWDRLQELCRHESLAYATLSTEDPNWDHLSWV